MIEHGVFIRDEAGEKRFPIGDDYIIPRELGDIVKGHKFTNYNIPGGEEIIDFKNYRVITYLYLDFGMQRILLGRYLYLQQDFLVGDAHKRKASGISS